MGDVQAAINMPDEYPCATSWEPGRTFRVPPRWYADISANLTIANMGVHKFADAADAPGTYRGLARDELD